MSSSSSLHTESEKFKIQNKFARKIIREARNAGYEAHEVGSLVDIVITSLKLDTEEEIFSFIVKCGICDPLVIGSIKQIQLSAIQIIDLMFSEGKEHFLINIEEAFEQGLLTLKDQDTREHLYERSIDFSENDVLRYVVKLSQHASSKRICGMLLADFTANMSSQEAIGFVDDVISHDFFHDLRGSLTDLLSYLPDIRTELTQLFEHRQSLSNGELVDSDEDEEGNLRDFVVDDDYESVESGGEADPPPKESKKNKVRDIIVEAEEQTTVDLTQLESPEAILRNSNKKARVQKKYTIYDDDNDE